MKYDLKKEKIAVHCQTLEEAEKVIRKLNKEYHCNQKYHHFKENGNKTCYDLWFSGGFGYADIEFYEKEGFKIIPASEYLSQFEEVPKYGDKVWVRHYPHDDWQETYLIDKYEDKVRVVSVDDTVNFEDGRGFLVVKYKHYRTTDPAKDKKVLELTLSEIAEKLGVNEVKIKE